MPSNRSLLLSSILSQLESLMPTIDQVLADVQAEATMLDSVSKLVGGLRQQVADALASQGVPPAVQAKIDQVFATAEANKALIAATLQAGPSDPPLVIAPTPSPTPAPAPVAGAPADPPAAGGAPIGQPADPVA